MIRILFLCWILTRHALSQTVSWTVGTSVPRFKEDLKLVCSVSSDCCTSFERIWADGAGNQIINNGISATPNKYVEEWNTSVTTGFSLIIKNLQLSDVSVVYDCQYNLGNNQKTLTPNGTWEYAPVERCPATIGFMQGLLISDLHVERSAPKPTFYARNQVNVTSLLTEKDVRTFETWFFSLTVHMEKKVTCKNDDRFILGAVTGTKTTNICDSVNLCVCLDCFGYCVAFSLILQLIGSVIFIAVLFKQGQLSCKKGCLSITAYVCLRLVMEYFLLTTLFNVLPSYLIGWFDCPCNVTWIWVFVFFLSCETGLVASWIIPCKKYDWIYLWDIFSKKSTFKKLEICCLGIISGGISFFISSAFDRNWFQGTGSKEDPFKVYVKREFEAVLECKDKDKKKGWAKKVDEGWKTIESFEKKKYKVSGAPACFKKMYYRLHVVEAKPDDEGIYKCAGEADKEYHFQLILKSDDAGSLKIWLYFGIIMVLTLPIITIPFLIIYFYYSKANSGKNRKKDAALNGADDTEML